MFQTLSQGPLKQCAKPDVHLLLFVKLEWILALVKVLEVLEVRHLLLQLSCPCRQRQPQGEEHEDHASVSSGWSTANGGKR
eukprot:1147207-Pelagomonas_calceolata.AAC.2